MQRWKCVPFFFLLKLLIEFFWFICAKLNKGTYLIWLLKRIHAFTHSFTQWIPVMSASCACPCTRKLMWTTCPWSLPSCCSQSRYFTHIRSNIHNSPCEALLLLLCRPASYGQEMLNNLLSHSLQVVERGFKSQSISFQKLRFVRFFLLYHTGFKS